MREVGIGSTFMLWDGMTAEQIVEHLGGGSVSSWDCIAQCLDQGAIKVRAQDKLFVM
jgi:hypothetical protein